MSEEKVVKHFVHFEISDELYTRVTQLIEQIRTSDRPQRYEKEIAQAVLDLVGVGFHFFFIDTLKRLHTGVLIQNTAKMGLRTLTRSMGVVIKRVVKSLNKEQILKAADIMEEMMETREVH